jgi:hypothetical protein
MLVAAASTRTFLDVSLPYAVDLVQGDYFVPSGASLENRLWVEIAPNTNLALLVPGAGISANVAAGDTHVALNAQAAAALTAFLTSGGVTQTDEVWFRLTSVPGNVTDFTALKKAKWDSANSRLVAYAGAAFGLTAAAGDALYVTVRFEDGTYLAKNEFVEIGAEILGSSSLPANTPIRFIVENADTAQVKIGFNLTYLHS